MTQIAGFDPGLANFGVAITDTELHLLEFRCIKTKKSKEKYVAVDMFKRGQEIARDLIPTLEEWEPALDLFNAVSSFFGLGRIALGFEGEVVLTAVVVLSLFSAYIWYVF